ncbi:MAG TPA: lipopolysaccharide kinase InaA family protein [Victivallales bacterium]|nr:lipopolysaccharide kinase InaA family protein [Victivallales bacterium]
MKTEVEKLNNNNLYINSAFKDILKSNGINSAEDLWNFKGESVKKQRKERGTERAFLKDKNGDILETYIKRYLPTSLKEKFKSFSSFHPVIIDGAFHEWEAIITFLGKDLPTMIPIAVAKTPLGTCNMTLGITDYVRAEELFKEFASNPTPENKIRKRKLLKKIANLASSMHEAGFCHQDFYLVHIFVKTEEDDAIYLIDLQRLIIQKSLKIRWRIKDLGQIYFSALPYISKTDIIYFWKNYSTKYYRNKSLIKAVLAKAERIKKHTEKKY